MARPPKKAIEEFKEPYRFLSNFYPCNITYEGMFYPSTEHAFQAAKTTDERRRFVIAHAIHPSLAKKMGRKVELRDGWEGMKLQVMEELLQQKFSYQPFADSLVSTGELVLIEGNWWLDRFWGACASPPVSSDWREHYGVSKDGKDEWEGETRKWFGLNNLGVLLMKIREELE